MQARYHRQWLNPLRIIFDVVLQLPKRNNRISEADIKNTVVEAHAANSTHNLKKDGDI